MIKKINQRLQTNKVSTGRNKNESVINIPKPKRTFLCIDEFFYKMVHLNITKDYRKWTPHSLMCNLRIKTNIENKGCLSNTQMNFFKNRRNSELSLYVC